MEACSDREVWFESPGRLARRLERSLARACRRVSVRVEGEGRPVAVEAECGECRVSIKAKPLGALPESLGVLARLAGEAGLGRVKLEFEVAGGCSDVCRLIELTLFKAGG